jgi:hypothetical protein
MNRRDFIKSIPLIATLPVLANIQLPTSQDDTLPDKATWEFDYPDNNLQVGKDGTLYIGGNFVEGLTTKWDGCGNSWNWNGQEWIQVQSAPISKWTGEAFKSLY